MVWMGPPLGHFFPLRSVSTLCVRQRDGASRVLLGQKRPDVFQVHPAAKLGIQAGGRQCRGLFKSGKGKPKENWGGVDEDPSAADGKEGWGWGSRYPTRRLGSHAPRSRHDRPLDAVM